MLSDSPFPPNRTDEALLRIRLPAHVNLADHRVEILDNPGELFRLPREAFTGADFSVVPEPEVMAIARQRLWEYVLPDDRPLIEIIKSTPPVKREEAHGHYIMRAFEEAGRSAPHP